MRNLTLCLILLPLLVLAQKREVFRIDSLPKEGVLLNQGWKWHAGDNPKWAKAEFDDAGWEEIDPTKEINNLQQLSAGQIGWLRMRLMLKENASAPLSLMIAQSSASEIYINGALWQQIGRINKDPAQIQAINPLGFPYALQSNKDTLYDIALRFVLQPGIHYGNHFGMRNPLFSARIIKSDEATSLYSHQLTWSMLKDVSKSAIYFIMGLIFYLLYIFSPASLMNLYFSLYAILSLASRVAVAFTGFSLPVDYYFWLNNAALICQTVGLILLLTSIYTLLEQPKSWTYWGFFLFCLISVLTALFFETWGWVLFGFGTINLVNIDIARVAFLSTGRRKKGVWIIIAGCIFYLFTWVAFCLFFSGILHISSLARSVLFDVSMMSIPISYAIFLSYDFGHTNWMLKQKLIEIESISAEKQLILTNQNETLEQQVTERTAELSQKNTELELEASLERLRSKALAMQQSKEVLDVAAVLYEELQKLGFAFGITSIHIIDAETGNMDTWVAGFGHENYPQSYHVPYSDHPFHKSEIEAWRNGASYSVHQMAGVEKKDYDDFFFTQTGYKDIPDEVKKRMIETEYVTSSIAYMKHGSLFWAPTPLSEEKAQVFQRFAIVFEQAYTRFLDLQKAEAQAEQARLNLIQIQTEKKRAEEALIALKQTQSQLIQSEKLASLGELTAGIAHEIQNPLNFVNNFAEISVDLAEELREEIKKPEIDKGLIEELATDLALNQEKINHHGKRASSIVKGMLEHSRVATSRDAINRVSTDLNALADEYLRLAYHGLRAKDNSFNATMETHFDPDLPRVEVIPQDIGRVLLNLVNNAFYAVNEKAKQGIDGYSPVVTVSTRKLTDAIEISIQDNGNGIPDAIKDKIFQPFFTTKPTGQGTGLGLSLAYDIVTKGHGGSIEVKSTEGSGTIFTLRLNLG